MTFVVRPMTDADAEAVAPPYRPQRAAYDHVREVGTYRRHGRLGGVWRDVVVVELLLDEPVQS